MWQITQFTGFLSQELFSVSAHNLESFPKIVRGLVSAGKFAAETFDPNMADSLVDHLFENKETGHPGLDLAALNIQVKTKRWFVYLFVCWIWTLTWSILLWNNCLINIGSVRIRWIFFLPQTLVNICFIALICWQTVWFVGQRWESETLNIEHGAGMRKKIDFIE